LASWAAIVVIFGSLRDRIGRKPIIMLGLILAMLAYFPLFRGLTPTTLTRRCRRRSPARGSS
jgi:MFS family permease